MQVTEAFRTGKHAIRAITVALVGCAISACSKENGNTATSTMNAEQANWSGFDSEPSVPRHRYDFREGDTYGYIADVSEEDQKKGKATGDVITFTYHGDQGGVYKLRMVDAKGREMLRYECSSPCVAIKVLQGGEVIERIAYNPSSVIGSAYEDALAGQLEVAKTPVHPLKSDWAGNYEGTFEGGTGSVTIKDRGPNIVVNVDVASERCVGQISFAAPRPSIDTLVKRFPADESGNQCKITLIRVDRALAIEEDDCSYYHGAECSFNGSTTK